MAADPGADTSIMRLPREIRDHIWDSAVADDDRIFLNIKLTGQKTKPQVHSYTRNALCLTSVSSNDNRGVIFFGDGPYNMLPRVDVSSGLLYTPLTFRRRGKYFVGVRSIKINQKPVPLNTSLLGKNV